MKMKMKNKDKGEYGAKARTLDKQGILQPVGIK